MEGLSVTLYRRFKWYWRRTKYQRLDGSRRQKKRVRIATMGRNHTKKMWGIKITPRLQIFSRRSAKQFFVRMRDAYVKKMLAFSNPWAFNGGDFGLSGKSLKEYDEKIIVEFYKSLVAQGKLVPNEGVRTLQIGFGR